MVYLQQVVELILDKLRTVYVLAQALDGLEQALQGAFGTLVVAMDIDALQMHADDVQNLAYHVRRVPEPVYLLDYLAHHRDVRLQPRIESRPQLRKQLHFLCMTMCISEREATLLILQMLTGKRERRNHCLLVRFLCALSSRRGFTILLLCFLLLGLWLCFRAVYVSDHLIVVLHLLHPLLVKYLILDKEDVLVVLAVFGLLNDSSRQNGVPLAERHRLTALQRYFTLLLLS